MHTRILFTESQLNTDTIYLFQVERDIMIWNSKVYQSQPLLVAEDRQILKFRRWYNQFYSENSPKFNFRKDSLEW